MAFLITLGTTLVMGASIYIMILRDKVLDLRREIAHIKTEQSEWKVADKAERWQYIRNSKAESKSGLAIYVKRERPRNDEIPIGHVAYDDKDFLNEVKKLRDKAEERVSDLNALV